MDNVKLTQIFATGGGASWFEECEILLRDFCPEMDLERLERVYADVGALFRGEYPGFGVVAGKYHDLHHTCSTTLATVRLLHGLAVDGRRLSPVTVEQGIYSAFFHDVGWIPTQEEQRATPSLVIEDHEERSVRFFSNYFQGMGFSATYCDDCADMIRCTNLDVDPETLGFRNEAVRTAGYVVGSADLISQMSDRCYLERLPFLFREQGYSKQFHYKTAFELLKKTAEFYSKIVTERLDVAFHNVDQSMRSHFRERWQIDKDLYSDNILKNLRYVNKITRECEDELHCIEKRLRRDISSC